MTTAQLIGTAFQHYQAGRVAETEDLCRQVLEKEPRNPAATHLLGLIAHKQKRARPAVELLRRSVEAAPGVADFRNNFGTVLADLRRYDEAAEQFRAALRLRADYAEARRNLGVALAKSYRMEEAAEALREAVRLRPDDAESWQNLVAVLHELGDVDGALDCRRRLLDLRPDDAAAHSEMLATLAYHPRYEREPQAMLDEVSRWARRHARPLYAQARPHDNDRSPERRPLRVGYFSPDLRDHPVGRYVEPLLRHHDRGQFTVYCYSDAARPDATTDRLRRGAAAWRDVVGLSDEELVEQIRRDGIDILVDLNGHLDSRRLAGVFARKPAPVQVTYAGHGGTTGLATMDYRVTDARHDPPGWNEPYHTEQLVRLPDTCLTYDPGDPSTVPDAGPLPADAAGRVTFGSVNRLQKLTPEVLDTWRRVLDAVPGSRLLALGHPETGELAGANGPVCRRFARHGIGEARLEVIPREPRQQYLKLFQRIDVLLDPFPYAGETTSLDALWMGVPVVTLAGRSYAARAGVNLLTNLGLGDLVAESVQDYARIAAGLAQDPARLRELRAGLRERMKASPLGDGGARVCRALEEAYRTMWRHYASGQTPAGGPAPSADAAAAAADAGTGVADAPAAEVAPEVAPELAGELPPALVDRMKEVGAAAGRVQGWLHADAGAALYRLARLHAPTPAVVELGSWKGRSTLWLASALRDRGEAGGKVWAVDTWRGSPSEALHRDLLKGYAPDQLFEEFRANVERLGLGNWVEPVRRDTLQASRGWPADRPIGLLFIDAAHDYRSVLRDFESWSPLVADGGYVVFDDVPGWPGPTRVANGLPRWYDFVGTSPNLWIVRKNLR